MGGLTRPELNKAHYFLPLILLLALLPSCTSTDAERINDLVLTRQRSSFSSERDVRLAQNSQKLLSQRDADYQIGPGDVLEISIYELEKLNEFKTLEARVEESGEITLPVMGTLQAGWITVGDLTRNISDKLVEDEFLKEPRVSVLLKEFRSKKIAILGAVHNPGEYMIRQNVITLLDALGMAGGPTEDAGYSLQVISSQKSAAREQGEQKPPPVTITVDLISLIYEGRLDLNVALEHGDVVFVPKAKKFFVIGFVRKPGGFPLREPITVLQGIAMAEGLMEREASPSDCAIIRMVDNKEEILPLDLVAIAKGERPDFYLLPDDVIDVRQTSGRFFLLELINFIGDIFHFGYQLNPRR